MKGFVVYDRREGTLFFHNVLVFVLNFKRLKIMELTEKQFCEAYEEFYGEKIDSVKQIAHIEFEDGKDLFEFAQGVVKILNKHLVIKGEAVSVCVHPFKFVVIHGSKCHCLKCGCDIDTQTDL